MPFFTPIDYRQDDGTFDRSMTWFMERIFTPFAYVLIVCLLIFLIAMPCYFAWDHFRPSHDTVTLDTTTDWKCTQAVEYQSRCGAKITHACVKTACTQYERR